MTSWTRTKRSSFPETDTASCKGGEGKKGKGEVNLAAGIQVERGSVDFMKRKMEEGLLGIKKSAISSSLYLSIQKERPRTKLQA